MYNGILVIDKPEGFTSFDVVAKLRGMMRERRIGHGGTLDPMATGVLPIFVGRATRAAEYAAASDKEYIARFQTGITTDTQDTTGTVLSRSDICPTRAEVEDVLPRFTGRIEQTPPMYSAVKVGGERLYKLARRGEEVERAPRPVEISALELLPEECAEDEYALRVVCSKGTYIRTLCHDIGQALGCGAAMSALRRTRAGRFTLGSAQTFDFLAALLSEGRIHEALTPTDALFEDHPPLFLRGEELKRFQNGAQAAADTALESGKLYRLYDEDGGFLAIGKAVDTKYIRTYRNF